MATNFRDRITWVRVLRSILGWAGWLQLALGLVSAVDNIMQTYSRRPAGPPGAPAPAAPPLGALTLTISGALTPAIAPFVGWAILTLLLEIYYLMLANKAAVAPLPDEPDEAQITG